jgi:hypothetical protein
MSNTTDHFPAFLLRPGATRGHWLHAWQDDGLGHVEQAGLSTWWVAERGDLAGWGRQGYYAKRGRTTTGPHPSRKAAVDALGKEDA